MQIVPIRDLRNTNEISEAEMDAGRAIDGEAAFAALKARYR